MTDVNQIDISALMIYITVRVWTVVSRIPAWLYVWSSILVLIAGVYAVFVAYTNGVDQERRAFLESKGYKVIKVCGGGASGGTLFKTEPRNGAIFFEVRDIGFLTPIIDRSRSVRNERCG